MFCGSVQGLILHQLQRYSLSEKVLRDAVQVNRWVAENLLYYLLVAYLWCSFSFRCFFFFSFTHHVLSSNSFH